MTFEACLGEHYKLRKKVFECVRKEKLNKKNRYKKEVNHSISQINWFIENVGYEDPIECAYFILDELQNGSKDYKVKKQALSCISKLYRMSKMILESLCELMDIEERIKKL